MSGQHARIVFVLGWTLLSVHALGAQPVGSTEMTVEEVVARALAENPELQAARADIDAAGARVRQAALRPNPMLDLAGQKALGPDNNVSIGVTVPLDLNGRKSGRIGVAEREVELRRAQLADRERRLRAEVRAKAGEVLAARRNLTVVDELLDTSRQGLRLVEERVRTGAAPALDASLMRVEVNRLEAGRPLLASRVDVSTLQLQVLAGLKADESLVLRGELTPPAVMPDGFSPADRPDVRAARAEVAASEARVRKEQAEGRWDASVNLGYQRQDFGYDLRGITDSGGTRQIQDVFHYFGGGVTITLPVRNRNQGNIAAAEAEVTAAERRRELVELIARREVQAAQTQQQAARRALSLFQTGVRDVARSNVEVVRRSYALGRATLLDVIGEQRRYIELEQSYTEALKQVYDAAIELERAVGTPAR